MRLVIETRVDQDPEKVWAGFDRELFLSLSPGFPKIELKRFDGCKKGDEVHLELAFPFFKQEWNSLIIESGLEDQGYYFIDQGIKLPFFLTYWEHKHRILPSDGGSLIVDDIFYKAYNPVFERLLFPNLWLSFYQRKSKYQKRFRMIPQ